MDSIEEVVPNYRPVPKSWATFWFKIRKKKYRPLLLALGAMLLLTASVVAKRMIGPPPPPPATLITTLHTTTEKAPAGFEDASLYPEKADIEFHPEALDQESPMTAQIFGNEIVIQKTAQNSNGLYQSWYGKVNGFADSYFLFVRQGDTYAGLLGGAGAAFAMKRYGDGYRLARINPDVLPVEEAASAPDLTMVPDPAAACEVAAVGATVQIDVLMLYTEEARTHAAQEVGLPPSDTAGARRAIELELIQALEVTNLAFSSSRLPIRLHLSAASTVGDAPSWETQGPLSASLHKLEHEPRVQQWRDAAGADLVCLIVENGADAGLGNYYNFQPQSGNRAYSVVRRDCASNNFSMAHELGHNLGLDHQCDISSRSGAGHGHYYRSHGKRVATIMAKKKGWNRLPFYSDASLGRGTLRRRGKIEDCYANDVEVLVKTAAIIANYRCLGAAVLSPGIVGPSASLADTAPHPKVQPH